MINNLCHVLVVEDSLPVLQRIEASLFNINCVYRVSVATTYDEAIEVLSLNNVDVATLDINLSSSQKSGIDVLKVIKKSYPFIKTIMLTNSSTQKYREVCSKIGADYFIDKTEDFECVPGLINNIYSPSGIL